VVVKQSGKHLVENSKGLFITDLDGTLLNDRRQIGVDDATALQRMRRQGVQVALATGRSAYSLERLINTLEPAGALPDLPFDYVIFSTGAGIMDYPRRRILRNLGLDAGDVLKIVSLLETLRLDYMIHKKIPETAHFLYAQHTADNPDFLRRLDIYKDFGAPVSAAGLAGFGEATEVLCIVPEVGGHAVAARLLEICKEFSVIKATSPLDGKSLWIEIFASGVSKSQAARWLADLLGFDRQQVCGVGNDYNDEDLLYWAGQSFVVANSPPSLRKGFPIVAANTHGGVAEAAARWLGW